MHTERKSLFDNLDKLNSSTGISKREHFFSVQLFHSYRTIDHFTVMYLVSRPLIWSEAEGDLVVIETCI